MTSLEQFLINADYNTLIQQKVDDSIDVETLITKISIFQDFNNFEKANESFNTLKAIIPHSNYSSELSSLILRFLEDNLLILQGDFEKVYTDKSPVLFNPDLRGRIGFFSFLCIITRCKALNLGGYYNESNNILESIIKNAQLNKYDIGLRNDVIIGIANRFCYINYYKLGNMDAAMNAADVGLHIFSEASVSNPYYLGAFYNSYGTLWWLKGELKLALDYFYEAVAIFTSINLTYYAVGIKNNISIILKDQGNLSLAIKYLLEIIDNAEKMSIFSKMMSLFYDNIGCLYRDIGEYDKAKLYLYKSYTIRKDQTDEYDLSTTLLNIFLLEEKMGLITDKSISLTAFPENKSNIKLVLVNKILIEGIYQVHIKNYSKALHLFQEILAVKGIEFRFTLLAYEYTAEIYLALDSFDELRKHLQNWRALAEANNLKPSLMKVLLISAKLELVLFNLDEAQVLIDKCFTIGFEDLPFHHKIALDLKKSFLAKKKLFDQVEPETEGYKPSTLDKESVLMYIKGLDKILNQESTVEESTS